MKAEIDTYYIDFTNTTTDNGLATIENAYLFNVKTIRLPRISKLAIFNTLFKLPNNPLNTVKRIIIDERKKNLDEIISELKSFDLKDYNFKKLPKIYLDGYRELILDEVNNELSILKIGEYDKYGSLCLILKRSTLEVNNLTILLYMLFNSIIHLREIKVEYDENDKELHAKPQFLLENRKKIIFGMLEIYEIFKVDKILFKEML